MSKLLVAAKQFEEGCESSRYFEMQSTLGAISKIQTILDGTHPQPIFLIGEPGSGKTFLLKFLFSQWSQERHIVLIETPFITPIDLLNQLIRQKGVQPSGDDIEQLRLQATELYGTTDHLIMIDEAQLLSTEMKEFIRILSDSKAFWFILAMHQSEGISILRAPHFKSRPHRIIELLPLTLVEGRNYIHRELIKIWYTEVIEELDNKLIAKAYEISEGNFRNFKKIFYHLFHILHHANTHNKTKYLRPSSCTMTMAAISAELLDD